MDNRPIGVFDSGLGGLSAVRYLTELMPQENIVYFGDTGRVPYGTRSVETIRRYASEDSNFLLSKNVKCIIAACGTVSSVAKDVLSALSVPTIGVITGTAAAAVNATRIGRIGIIGTAATVRSRAFNDEIAKLNPSIQITAIPCPMLVPLVENGWIDPEDEVAVPMVRRYLQPIIEAGVDTLILGCTHFPLLAPIIHQYLGNTVTLIDSGRETAKRCADYVAQNHLKADRTKGECHFFVSDRPDDFTRVAEIFLGQCVSEEVEMISTDQLLIQQKG